MIPLAHLLLGELLTIDNLLHLLVIQVVIPEQVLRKIADLFLLRL